VRDCKPGAKQRNHRLLANYNGEEVFCTPDRSVPPGIAKLLWTGWSVRAKIKNAQTGNSLRVGVTKG